LPVLTVPILYKVALSVGDGCDIYLYIYNKKMRYLGLFKPTGDKKGVTDGL
jgi:hypothetical protein